MKSYELNPDVFRYADTVGTQWKAREQGYWYKVDGVGCEGLAEELTSLVLRCSILPKDVCYVSYERCIINGRKGCRSANFVAEGEINLSLQELYQNTYHGELSDRIMQIPEVADRIAFVVDMVKQITKLDITDYLKAVLTLDAFTRNPDRHFGNLSVIRKPDGTFRLAPIFDNGQALGQNFEITDPFMSHEEKLEALAAAPFSASFEKQLSACGIGLFIDFDLLRTKMQELPKSLAKTFLIEQISLYEKMLAKPAIHKETKQKNTRNDIELD